ncbi:MULTISPECIES: hypothetical protein [unclassified Streptomyces]
MIHDGSDGWERVAGGLTKVDVLKQLYADRRPPRTLGWKATGTPGSWNDR